MIFCNRLPTKINVNGKVYRIRPYFNNVLFCMELYKDKSYSDEEKVYLSYKALVKNKKRISLFEKSIVLNNVFKMIFESEKKGNSKKSFDFEQDAKYIYSGFMQAYGIDLFNSRNKLHWWKFNALFQGLPKETRIMQIIDIRLQPIPKRTKYNQEYVTNLIKMKAEYKLELSQEEREKEMQEALGNLFQKLKGMAKEKR